VRIASLQIENLRIVEHMQLSPGKGINFVVGGNGAGKTSILEAIYLAGRGRTFRHAEAGPMIREGADRTRVLVEIGDEVNDRASFLGVERARRSLICRLNGRDVQKRSWLAEALPLQWIGSQPQLLLSMGPEVRRRFLDMGLFHVEPAYLALLGECHRALKQRNAAVRGGDPDQVRLWNAPFADAAERLTAHRRSFSRELLKRTRALLQSWRSTFSIDFLFRPGWGKEDSLLVQLESRMPLDFRMGHTTVGPQRADLQIAITQGGLAEKRLSRGQQKLLVFAIHVGLNSLIEERKGHAPVLLIDDVASELDRLNRATLLTALAERAGQAFVASITLDSVELGLPNATMFHVEHGRLLRTGPRPSKR
jgi:DNA replication and repair protein RecF